MTLQFKNMNELLEYLGVLDGRIRILEEENRKLLAALTSRENIDGNAIARYVSRSLPNSAIVSPSFLKRAFAVWGHMFVANLIVGTIAMVVYFCLVIVLFGSLFGGMIQSTR